MPERYTRPPYHERVENVERMKRAWEAESDALVTVQEFNSRMAQGRAVWFWPKVTAALTAKHPWVTIVCDSCDGATHLDLRMKPRDPEASIRIVLRDAKCPRCNGHGRPRIVGLATFAK